jgi:glycosyltransferase involved in cell wall biosynthesis
MNKRPTCQSDFDQYKICVLIPTYNNAGSIAAVVSSVSEYTSNIVIVNDGSTDETPKIISMIPGVQVHTYANNRGKGWALRQGFKYVTNLGYQYAITIDSDGQHFADDLPAFVADLKTHGDGIIIGARNMEQSSVPGKSSTGNKISSFWFRVETGVKMPDTQSGYRLYPVHRLENMKWITRKYEFEIEVMVRASWKGIPIRCVPVKVYYAPRETRISHFRPFKDFTRITILNIFLVFITFLWIKPRDFFRVIFQKKKLKELLRKQFYNTGESDIRKSASIAFGLFMGIIPIWGFQLVAAIFLAMIFRLNKALVIIAANISIPPMIPLLIFLSYKMGAWWMGDRVVELSFSRNINLNTIKANLEQYIYGSITLAIIAALLGGVVSWVALKATGKRNRQLTGGNNQS